ncbi:iron ABC transporter permease [Corynebacterium glucuronolyticum]|uniref:FecCD family ABC transporter permease n=2 Tax=Corynebacterium glucuronolyticum TaxID=39791 RepID=UPI00223AF38C|nr:iron ABC transporter permease [Corynebacterium glucuronolyticum]MCT1563892.1 iron ABC transporter permease [Corynebacterium glucuronolyticum]
MELGEGLIDAVHGAVSIAAKEEQVTSHIVRTRKVLVMAVAVVLLCIAAIAATSSGALGIGFGDLVSHVTGAAALNERDLAVITQIRLPRVVNALIVGATLAVSGAVFQTLFRNPLADPYFLGVSSGASLGVTAAMMAGASSAGVIPAAFVGGMAAVGIAFLVATGAGSHPTVIVLAGVAVSAFAGAVQSYLQIRDLKKLEGVYVWLLGNLGRAGWKDIATVLCVVVPCWCSILAASKALDVLTLGEAEAQTLGINVQLARVVLIAVATLATSAVVSISGLIGFVGIVVPHMLRLMVGPGHGFLLPLTIVAGAGFLLAADTIARSILAPQELPVGVVTAFIGAPFFLFLLIKAARGGVR